jgi:hypothetical protein
MDFSASWRRNNRWRLEAASASHGRLTLEQ